MPKVSVILTTYNRTHLVGEAIESVLAQTYQDWELIVMDDGSADGTGDIVKAFAQKDSRVRCIHRENMGISAVRARSIAFAEGEYITFLDDDDEFAPDKLERQVSFLDAHPEAGLVYSYVDMIDAEKKLIRKWPYRAAESFVALIKDCVIQPNATLVRMECFKRLGTFRLDFKGGDDYEMWLRIAKFYPIAFLPFTAGTYRWHTSNFSHDWKKRCFNDVNVFKAVRAYDLSCEERKAVTQRVIELTYTKGSDAFSRGDYRDALFYFTQALRFGKTLGIHIAWGRSKNWFYGLLRPYVALVLAAVLFPLRGSSPKSFIGDPRLPRKGAASLKHSGTTPVPAGNGTEGVQNA